MSTIPSPSEVKPGTLVRMNVNIGGFRLTSFVVYVYEDVEDCEKIVNLIVNNLVSTFNKESYFSSFHFGDLIIPGWDDIISLELGRTYIYMNNVEIFYRIVINEEVYGSVIFYLNQIK